MNEYDSEIARTILLKNAFSIASKPEEASVILLNTCSVRENAHRKVMQRLSELQNLRSANHDLIIGVIGCMAQSMKGKLIEDGTGVDIIAGPDTYRRLPELIRRFETSGEKESDLILSRTETYSDVFPVHDQSVNAWIAVMRGCNNACSFCIVPYARGRERSRSPQNVVDEARQIAEQGFKQITLLGQNVNSYTYGKADFADLINRVSDVDGISRIRFTSPHPKDFPLKLIDVVRDNPKACKHIHLPLQAGNDRILELMRRTYTQSEYLRLAHLIKTEMPDITITTDIIVGFPSETEEEFLDTLHVVKEVGFDAAFMFKYSERENTLASRKYPDDVPEEAKTSRITRLVDLQRKISLEKNTSHVGEIFEVLVEGPAKKPYQSLGRNDGNKIVVFPNGRVNPGDFVNVRINEATPNTLIGELIAT